MTRAYIGLGSNLGDPAENVRAAADRIAGSDCIQSLELSPLYRTAPVGKVDQGWFVNAVARVETSLDAAGLLRVCLAVEGEFRRERKERWGPRTLDVDILLFGDERIDSEALRVPHPRMTERAFVLAPLVDLDTEIWVAGRRAQDWLVDCAGQEIERIEDGVC